MVVTFGQLLRSLRQSAGLTQTRLAAAADIDPTYLSKVETGAMEPPAEATIEALARAMSCDATGLLLSAGKVPRDIRAAILERPDLVEYIRQNHVQYPRLPRAVTMGDIERQTA